MSTRQPLTVPNQIQLDTFAKALLASLSLWSALQIALQASARSDELPEDTQLRLATEILDAFLEPYSSSAFPKMPEQFELADFLKEFIDVELDTLVEDESDVTLAKELISLWRSICLETVDSVPPHAQDRVTQLITLAEKRKGVKIQINTQSDLADSSDESSDEESDNVNEATGMDIDGEAESASQDRDSGYASTSPNKSKAPPIVDDDGFQTVQYSRKR